MSKFLNNKFQSLEVYVPGEQPDGPDCIKLNTNESPFPPAPQVIDAVDRSQVETLNLYPDSEYPVLKKKIADRFCLTARNVFLSNGSDETLNFAFLSFAGEGKKVWFPEITYGFYQVFADLYQIEAVAVPLQEDFSICIDDYCSLPAEGGLICIANPNAPTCQSISLADIERILAANPDKVVLIDEAYVDFGGKTAVPLLAKYENLLVVQTFSKSRSLAGARLGFGLANAALIEDLDRIKYSTNPYNINRLTAAAGEAALDAEEYYQNRCQEIMKTRDDTARALKELGFYVLPTSTNFLFAKSDRISGSDLYEALKARGVLVRHFTKPAIEDFNRITIGTREEMGVMIEKIKEILEV